MSADGRYVAFYGTATNLVPEDTDDNEDVYLRDRATGQTTLVSVSSGGVKGNSNSWRPTISADGRYVAFQSEATNLVPGDTNGRIDLFVRDLWTGKRRARRPTHRASSVTTVASSFSPATLPA
jgi:Tol biopolymer transport system component